MTLDELKLGDTVYEIDPWTGRVFSRYVCSVETTEFIRCEGGPVVVSRRIRVSGGLLGSEVKPDECGYKFFRDPVEARRRCVERALAMKAEREAQIQKQIDELQEQLKGGVK